MKGLINKTTFIVGNKKNSGKTTFLNLALAKLRGKGRLAYLSIGVDGEMSDQIFGFPKPRVHAQPGDYVVTLDHALEHTAACFKVLKTFPYKTVLGRPKLILTTGPGDIEIIGPENNTQLAAILKYLRGRMRIRTILIDGAINRITQVASFKNAQFVFVCRVDPDRVESAADELKRMIVLSKVRCHPGVCHPRGSWTCHPRGSNRGSRAFKFKGFPLTTAGMTGIRGDDTLCFFGPLTPSKAANIPPSAKKIVVEDFTKIFLNYRELVKVQRRHKLYFQFAFKLAHVVVNLFGVRKSELFKHTGQVNGKIKVNEIK